MKEEAADTVALARRVNPLLNVSLSWLVRRDKNQIGGSCLRIVIGCVEPICPRPNLPR